MYDMMRAKAKSMGHAAANLPDAVFEKYMDRQSQQSTLMEAKLYIENYMMGELEPAELAQVMAENDKLRYTISDLCRMRLEPTNLDIQRNNSYIDVGAGLKTFWTEIQVPLPSERDAARDIRNINVGIEAGRSMGGGTLRRETTEVHEIDEDSERTPRKPSFRDRLNRAKQRAAEVAIEKLTPIAEGKKEKPQLNEAWLETEEGQEYKDAYTRRFAQQIENVAMDIEARHSKALSPEDRKKAFEAAGVSEDIVEKQVSEHDNDLTEDQSSSKVQDMVNRAKLIAAGKLKPGEKLADDIKTQTSEHDDNMSKDLVSNEDQIMEPEKLESSSKVQDMVNRARLIAAGKLKPGEKYVDDVKAQASKLFTGQDGNVVHFADAAQSEPGNSQSGYSRHDLNRPLNDEMQTMFDQISNKPVKLQSGYSPEDLNRPLNDEMQTLLDQISEHMQQDNASQHKSKNDAAEQAEPNEYGFIRKNKHIYGNFDGVDRGFSDHWGGYTFTDEDAAKLLDGESITFDCTNKRGQIETITGNLAWIQNRAGTSYLGFEGKTIAITEQAKQTEQVVSDQLFNASDEDLMNYYMGAAQEPSAETVDYYTQLAEDMANYVPDDQSHVYTDESIELSDEDCAKIHDDAGMKL